MRLEIMRGKINILSNLMSTSPGKETNMMTSSLGSPALPANPMMAPRVTPIMVASNSLLSLAHDSVCKEK